MGVLLCLAILFLCRWAPEGRLRFCFFSDSALSCKESSGSAPSGGANCSGRDPQDGGAPDEHDKPGGMAGGGAAGDAPKSAIRSSAGGTRLCLYQSTIFEAASSERMSVVVLVVL